MFLLRTAVLSLLVTLVVVCCCVPAALSINYTFPTRFQYYASGWATDAFVGGKNATVVGFVFTDYSIPAQRVDEIWNMSSVFGTTLYNLGITSDHHLYFADKQYYFYNNGTDNVCEPLKIGIIPTQDAFSNDTTYNGTAFFNGELANEFVILLFKIPKVTLSFYVSVATNTPLGMFIQGVPTIDITTTAVYWHDFQVLDGPFPSQIPLFQIPSYCNSSAREPDFYNDAQLHSNKPRRGLYRF